MPLPPAKIHNWQCFSYSGEIEVSMKHQKVLNAINLMLCRSKSYTLFCIVYFTAYSSRN